MSFNNRIYVFSFGLALLMFACQSSSNQKENSSKFSDSIVLKKTIENTKTITSTTELENSNDGVVVLKENFPKGKLRIYNSDHTIWKAFELDDNLNDSDLAPFAIEPENSLLVFRSFGKKNGMHEVIVDENKNIIKYINESDSNFSYEPWQQHILKVFSVDFNYKENPIRYGPSDKTEELPYNREEFYHPVKVQDEWLMIKDDNENQGWIKWKDNKGNLAITLYYDA